MHTPSVNIIRLLIFLRILIAPFAMKAKLIGHSVELRPTLGQISCLSLLSLAIRFQQIIRS